MHARRIRPLGPALSVALVVFLLSVTSSPHAEYSTSTGAKPDVQALRSVDNQSIQVSADFLIYVDTSIQRYNEIAAILNEEIDSVLALTLTVADVSTRGENQNQIVLGDVGDATIAALVAAHGRSTQGLGTEGYDLISLPNPNSSNGSWLIFIAANDTVGVLHGVFTLSDFLANGTSGSIGNLRIRDFPERPHREVQHWIPVVDTGNPQGWLDERTKEFRDLAARGANAVSLGRSDFFRMNNATYGPWLKQAIDAALYYGLEPIPEIHWPVPAAPTGPKWPMREGELIEKEMFVVGSDWMLEPVDTFDNIAHNMNFDSTDATGWPLRWAAPTTPEAGRWISGSTAADVWVAYTGAGEPARLRAYIDTLTGPRLQPLSLYTLKGTFSNVNQAGYAQIDVFARLYDGSPRGCPGELPPPNGPYTVSITDWGCFAPPGFFVHGSASEFSEDFYFWTPPTRTQVDTTVYNGPYFEDAYDFFLQITVPGGQSSFTLKAHGFFLERAASSLRNVMTEASPPQWDLADLPFTISNENGSTTYSGGGADYSLDYRPPKNYLMETHPENHPPGNVSSVAWHNTSLSVGDTVYLSYTVGLPDDWDHAGNQATTYCLKSPAFHDWIDNTLLYEFFLGQYAFDPKFLNVRFDEIRGMNRCGRCRAAGVAESNSMHIVTYLKQIQARLDARAGQDSAAADARLVVYAGPMWPANIGSDAGYQFSWGGIWGATQALGPEFNALNGSNLDLILNTRFRYWDEIRSAPWPGAHLMPGQSASTIGHMIDGEINSTKDYPEIAEEATWYAADGEGFLVAGGDYDTIHVDAEHRLMDYAWKRYRNPQATMHVFQDGLFAGVAGDTVVVPPFTALEFAPFGRAEARDSTLQDPVVSATIDWGDGSGPVDVFGQLNEGVVPREWIYGTRDVTLEVRTQTGATNTATVTVEVDTSDPNITLWSVTHNLTQDHVVDDGKALIVAPGTKITVTNPVGITVHGKLGIAGTASAPVEFCASDTTDPGGWSGILIQDSVATSLAVIEHCVYRNAYSGLGTRNSLTVRNTTIRNCERLGLSIAGSDSVYASHVTIRDIPGDPSQGIGINLLESASARFDSCTVDNVYTGAIVYGQATMYLSQSALQRHGGQGLWVTNSGKLFADGCVIDSSYAGIYGTSSATLDVRGSTVKNGGNGLSLWGASLSAVFEDCSFKNNDTGAYISGAPNVSITSSSFENSTNEGIYCLGGSNITIDGVTVSGGTIGIKLDASSPTITDNSIHDNISGIHCDGGASPTLKRNNLVDNTSGITTMSGSAPVLDYCGGSCSQSCANANTIRGGTGYRYSNLDASFTADAECTFWGRGSKVPASWFYGLVDYTPALSQDPIAPVVAPREQGGERLPIRYVLSANYPNPFNPATTIAFEVPAPGGRVSIQVYNVAGQRVAKLLDSHVVPGYHTTTWAGVNRQGSVVSTGMYFVQMRAQGFVQTRKLLLLK